MRLKKIILPALLFMASIVSAQRILSVEEAIATALDNNYDILLAKTDSTAFAIDYSYRNAGFIPRLNANGASSWTEFDTRQILSDGTVRESKDLRSNNINSQIALSWTLFDGLKMFATRSKAAEFVKLGELGIKEQVINTVSAVIGTYYNIVRQKQQLRSVEEQMSINDERVKLAQYKLDIGTGTKPDVLQSKVDLNAQKAAKLEQEKLIAQLKEELNRLMNPSTGVVFGTAYEVSDSIPLNTSIVLDDIVRGIEITNPSLLIAKKNIDIAGFTLKERKAERWPTVSFNSAYNFTRTNNLKVINSFSTLYNRNSGLNFGFTASVPILNNFNTRRLIQQAQLNIQYQELIYANQRSLVNMTVINAFKDYEQQKKALELEESNILLARENVSIIFQTYRLGAATYIQLREAQKSLEDGYNRLIAARYNTKLAETALLRLQGNLVR